MLSDLLRSHSELGPELRLNRESRKPRSPAVASVPPCTSPAPYTDHLCPPTPKTPLQLQKLEARRRRWLLGFFFELRRYWDLGGRSSPTQVLGLL